MTKEMAYSLAAMCQEASRLYDECIDKADKSNKARAMSQTDYVNGVQQHPLSKQSFSSMADGLEAEFSLLLQQLRGLSANGESLVERLHVPRRRAQLGFSQAMQWCIQTASTATP